MVGGTMVGGTMVGGTMVGGTTSHGVARVTTLGGITTISLVHCTGPRRWD